MSTVCSDIRNDLRPLRSRNALRGVLDVYPVRRMRAGRPSGVYLTMVQQGRRIVGVVRQDSLRWDLSAGCTSFVASDCTGTLPVKILRRGTRAGALAALLRYLRGKVVRA